MKDEKDISGISELMENVQMVGWKNVLRQLASTAAIMWGVRSSVNMAGEAQETMMDALRELQAVQEELEKTRTQLVLLQAEVEEISSTDALTSLIKDGLYNELIENLIWEGQFDWTALKRIDKLSGNQFGPRLIDTVKVEQS